MSQITSLSIIQLLQHGLSHDNLLDVVRACSEPSKSAPELRGLGIDALGSGPRLWCADDVGAASAVEIVGRSAVVG